MIFSSLKQILNFCAANESPSSSCARAHWIYARKSIFLLSQMRDIKGAGLTMEYRPYSPRYIFLNPQPPAPSVIKVITIPSQSANTFSVLNVQNVSPNVPIIQYVEPSVPKIRCVEPSVDRYRKILPKQNNSPVGNPQVNPVKSVSEKKQDNAFSKKSVVAVDLTNESDEGEEEDDFDPKDQINGGVEVSVYPHARGLSCENYNFYTKDKNRTR